jgi:hypothetical protein
MKVLMCHPQASAPAAAASAHQVNCVFQVNFARRVAHEEAALRKKTSALKKMVCISSIESLQFIKLDKVALIEY